MKASSPISGHRSIVYRGQVPRLRRSHGPISYAITQLNALANRPGREILSCEVGEAAPGDVPRLRLLVEFVVEGGPGTEDEGR